MVYDYPPVRFKYIIPAKIPAFWDLILPGVNEIRRKAGTQLDWTLLQLYDALVTGKAALFIGMYEGQYGGFLVVRPFWRGGRLLIWLAYSAPLVRRARVNVLDPGMKLVSTLAREIGASAIEMETTRTKAWARRLRRYEFKPVTTIFLKEVD